MIHVVLIVAVDYLVALCIYAVASLTLAGVRGYRLEVPDLHETPKDVFCVTPSVDARMWFMQVPYPPKGGPVPIADFVDHVAVNAVPWLHSTKDDVTNHQ